MANDNGQLVEKELSYQITGILFKVHNDLGRYRNEQQYADALAEELKKAKINFQKEYIIPSSFAGEEKGRNKIDFLIEDKVVLELKAKSFLARDDYYQTRRYLVSANKQLALLVNFRQFHLVPKRILNPNFLKK